MTWAVNDLRLYNYGFDKYEVAEVTGIDRDGLTSAAQQIRAYFNSGDEPLEVRADVFRGRAGAFQQPGSGAYAGRQTPDLGGLRSSRRLRFLPSGIVVVGAWYSERNTGESWLPLWARRVLWGSGLTVGLVGLVGLIALVGFDSMFLLYHRVSFANDFWQFDPRRDYLVMMFPQGSGLTPLCSWRWEL